MENFNSVNKVVDFSHKTLHENNFRKANAHVPQFGWKRLKNHIILVQSHIILYTIANFNLFKIILVDLSRVYRPKQSLY